MAEGGRGGPRQGGGGEGEEGPGPGSVSGSADVSPMFCLMKCHREEMQRALMIVFVTA